MARGYRTPRPKGKFTDFGLAKKADAGFVKGLLLAFPEGFERLPREILSVYDFDFWLGTPWLEFNDAWYGAAVPDLALLIRNPNRNQTDCLQNVVALARDVAETMDEREGGRHRYWEKDLRFKISREGFPVLYVSNKFDFLREFMLDLRASNIKHDESRIEVVENPFVLSQYMEAPKPSDDAPRAYVRLWWD